MNDLNTSYKALACAIIARAIKDHASKEWFESDWCRMLLTVFGSRDIDVSGEALWRQAEENRKMGYREGIRPVPSDRNNEYKDDSKRTRGGYWKQ